MMRVIEVEAPRFQSHAHSFFVAGKGAFSKRGYTAYKAALRGLIADQVPEPLDCEHVEVRLAFCYPMPRRMRSKDRFVYRSATPDLDNIVKPILDSLSGIAYSDDKSVVLLGRVVKVYDALARKHTLRISFGEAPDPMEMMSGFV